MVDTATPWTNPEWRRALHAWFQTIRQDPDRAIAELAELLTLHPDVRSALLIRMGDQLSLPLMQRVLEAYPELLPGDAITFAWALEHSPRLLEAWVRLHTLTPDQAWQIVEAAQHRRISRQLLEAAFRALPEDFRTLYSMLSEAGRQRLMAWKDWLFRVHLPGELRTALADWLEGRPVWHAEAIRQLRQCIDEMDDHGANVLWTLPDLIRKLLHPESVPRIRQNEVLWILHHTAAIPSIWVEWVVDTLTRMGNPILWALARTHPDIAPHVPATPSLKRGWYALRTILKFLDIPLGPWTEAKLYALLSELGVTLRQGKRQTMAAVEDLAAVLEMLPIQRFVHRLQHFYHEQEITRDRSILRELLHRRLIRRTVVRGIVESRVDDAELRRVVHQIVRQRREARKIAHARLRRLIEQNLRPPSPRPFQPDAFQVESVQAFLAGKDVLVTAPTGSGKTWIAEQAMQHILERGGRAFYATPLRALSYQKLRAFREKYGWENVGVLTGEYRENASAPLLVGTTEIVRNLLLDEVFFDLLVLDEAHYIGDVERGSAWEESLLLAPRDTRLILLSATIPNAEEVATWLRSLDRPIEVITREERPVPLVYLTWMEEGPELGLHARGRHPGLREMLRTLHQWQMTPALVFVGRRDDAMVLAHEATRFLPRKKSLRDQLPEHPLARLLERGIGVHHAGLSYAFRETVESLMEQGALDFIFCTSSLAHGIDAPVRTTVLYDVSPFWSRSELQHALGRAGRRGFDQVGFAVIALPAAVVRSVIRALRMGPQPLASAFAPHDAAIAGLVARYGIDGTLALAQRSLRVYQGDRSVHARVVDAIRRLVRLGFMERDGRLTDMGRNIVKLMHPNATGVVLALETIPHISPKEMALIASFFSNERPPRRIRKQLRHPLIRTMTEIARMAELEEIDPRDGARRAWIILQWMQGREDDLREMVGVEAEGDLERLRIQVVELLRKIESLHIPAATFALSVLDPHFAMEHPDWRGTSEVVTTEVEE